MMGRVLRLALRDLRGGLRGVRILIACLVLGVAAIAAIGTVRAALEAGLAREGAALLGGDAAVEFTYRFATDEERAWMAQVADDVSETVDFRSMLVVDDKGQTRRALTQVRAVDGLYPLIGAVRLAPDIPLDVALSGRDGLPGAVIEPDLAARLDVVPGDTLRLGTQDFVLSAILERYPDNAGGGFALGPRSLVRTDALAQSGLITPGTLYSTDYRLTLPAQTDLTALAQQAEDRFGANGLRWRDARAGAPGLSAFVDRLGAFLILVGLSGLAVGGVGISASVRSYLDGKRATLATLKTLGATRGVIFGVYGVQLALLTALGVAGGLILGAALPAVLAPLLTQALPVPAVFGLYPAPLAEAAIYGVLTAALFALWPLGQAARMRSAALYRDDDRVGWPGAGMVGVLVFILAMLVLAAGLFSDNWRMTLWTLGGLIVALVALALAAVGIAALARRLGRRQRGRPALRLALGAIGTRRAETAATVLAIGLGLSVLATVGQVDGTLRRAIQGQLPDIAPSYFVVDIQPDQIAPLKDKTLATEGVTRLQAAPMLRGIITRINGQPATDVAGDHWVLQGDRGVTYSAQPPKGTTITAGQWWDADYTGPPQVSFAREEAEELGLTLGDQITVNILGRDIDAEITSLREVAFETAGIGFVMSMSPSALAGAPHSWIATIYATPEAEGPLVRDLSDAYPNITTIRVRDAIDRAAEILGGIATATRYGALVTLLTGGLVLLSAALSGERARTQEAAILRSMGATRGQVLRSFAWRAGLMGLAAGAVALGAGLAGGWAVARFVLDTDYAVIWGNAIAIILGGISASLIVGLALSWRPLSARPARVLRARE